jgi:hypothetical protein
VALLDGGHDSTQLRDQFNYGFHISALNALQTTLSCSYLQPGSRVAYSLNLPECIAMNVCSSAAACFAAR